MGSTRRLSCRSPLFTLAGKRRAARRILPTPLGAATAFTLLVAPANAFARPHVGPSASASIEIRLSVAPRYQLKASRVALSGETLAVEHICLASNGPRSPLPVLLLAGAGQTDIAQADRPATRQLGWCGDGQDGGASGEAAGLLIVRPE